MIQSADEFRRLRLSDNPAEYQRAAIEDAPFEVWLEVIKRFPDLKVWVGYNKSASNEILRILAADEDVFVRERVAERRKLDQDTFSVLARDPDASVRTAIAENPKTPINLLKELACDTCEWVSSAAMKALERRSGRVD